MYAIVDIETTGGYAAANGITEIAVYVHNGKKVTKHFTTLINPLQKIPLHITALTGIDNAMVAAAPTFDEISDTLIEVLGNNIFVAHNVNFDYSFIKHQFKNVGYDLTNPKLCTVRLSRKIFQHLPSYSLGKLCQSLHINVQNRHRADGDAKATVQLFEKCLQNNGQFFIDAMLKKNSKEQWLPMNLDKTIVDALPSKPGVYYFFNKKNKVIYVGKAINIKKRVSSHFTQNDADKKRQNFIRNIYNVTYKECATELEALVFESTEIKKLWPLYNRSQKQPLQKYGLYFFEDARGYHRLAIDKKKKNIPSLYVFNGLHEGTTLLQNMVQQFELDDKLCFLNKKSVTQKDYEFLENPTTYNKKISNAMQALSKQLPTFVLLDDGINADEKLCLLVERGNFWGMGFIPKKMSVNSTLELKQLLNPHTDNDYIRNSIYAFADANPHKKIML
jgi:DNA polymerase III subunit epsilon